MVMMGPSPPPELPPEVANLATSVPEETSDDKTVAPAMSAVAPIGAILPGFRTLQRQIFECDVLPVRVPFYTKWVIQQSGVNLFAASFYRQHPEDLAYKIQNQAGN